MTTTMHKTIEDVADELLAVFAEEQVKIEHELQKVQQSFTDYVESTLCDPHLRQLVEANRKQERLLCEMRTTLEAAGIRCSEGAIQFLEPWKAIPGLSSGWMRPADIIRALTPTKTEHPEAPVRPPRPTLPPALPRWDVPIRNPTQPQSRSTVLPPVSLFTNSQAHHCTFYMWFSMRDIPFAGTTSAANWAAHLFQTPGLSYSRTMFDYGPDWRATACADCGMPSLLPKLLATAAKQEDFKAPALQAVLLAELELAQAQAQFEQTDDVMLGAATWAPEARLERVKARQGVFNYEALQDESVLRAFLQSWPGFAERVGGDDGKLVGFYLQMVADVLHIVPARPRRRPEAAELPEQYRFLVE